MVRCKNCNSIVPEGSEVCKACGKPLYGVAEEDKPRRRNPKISIEIWWVIIGVSIVVGFVSHIGKQKRQDEIEQALVNMEESTEMIQAVQASIHKVDSETEMPEISYEDMKLTYAPGAFSLNEKNSKPAVKYYENEDKTEVFVISMTYAGAAAYTTRNYIEEALMDEIGSYDKTAQTYNGYSFFVYRFSSENKLSEKAGVPIAVEVYVHYVGEAYYVYIESMTTDNNGFTGRIEEVLESIEIVEK